MIKMDSNQKALQRLSSHISMFDDLANKVQEKRNIRKSADASFCNLVNDESEKEFPKEKNVDDSDCLTLIKNFKIAEKYYANKLKEQIPVFKYIVKNHNSDEIKREAGKIRNNLNDLLQLETTFESCLASTEKSEEVLSVFEKYKSLFQAYKDFFMKNDKFHSMQVEMTVSEDLYKKEIGLGAVLFQRLVQYKLFLEELRGMVNGRGRVLESLTRVLETISDILNECNKQKALDIITPTTSFFPGRRTPTMVCGYCPMDPFNEYGTFYVVNKFTVSSPALKGSFNLHLFSKAILITKDEENGKSNAYVTHIGMNNVRLGPLRKNPKILVLEEKFKKTDKWFRHDMEARDAKICKDWRIKIEEILTQQLVVCKESEEMRHRHKK